MDRGGVTMPRSGKALEVSVDPEAAGAVAWSGAGADSFLVVRALLPAEVVLRAVVLAVLVLEALVGASEEAGALVEVWDGAFDAPNWWEAKTSTRSPLRILEIPLTPRHEAIFCSSGKRRPLSSDFDEELADDLAAGVVNDTKDPSPSYTAIENCEAVGG